MIKFNNDWDALLEDLFAKPSYLALRKFLADEYSTQKVYPKATDIFNCFRLTPYKNVKVVILGQDPYHQPGQAEGLCFSVADGVKFPPSLVNIFKEAGCNRTSGSLRNWANQGVFLLNTCLTVRQNSPMSHKGKGWEEFTDAVIEKLNQSQSPIVFMLWGSPARAKKPLITNSKHLILETVHPSPLSAYAGFIGCGHFKKANEFLAKNGLAVIDWA